MNGSGEDRENHLQPHPGARVFIWGKRAITFNFKCSEEGITLIRIKIRFFYSQWKVLDSFGLI